MVCIDACDVCCKILNNIIDNIVYHIIDNIINHSIDNIINSIINYIIINTINDIINIMIPERGPQKIFSTEEYSPPQAEKILTPRITRLL